MCFHDQNGRARCATGKPGPRHNIRKILISSGFRMPTIRTILRHAVFYFATTIFLALLSFQTYAATNRADIDELPTLKEGDIIFQTNLAPQSIATMLASDTLYTHVGIIHLVPHGQPVVIEVGPVRETPLKGFMARGVGSWVSIRRIKDLSSGDAEKAIAWARQQFGKPYDLFFLNRHDRFYCSQLVEDAFKDGAGISLGKYEKIGELKKSSAMDKVIESRWQMYPLCHGDKSMTYDKCYRIIMAQDIITPASIARDPRMEGVYSNYPF
jgi:cell wall-associated NlpC family hydrolase